MSPEQATVLANIMRVLALVGTNTVFFLTTDFWVTQSPKGPFLTFVAIIVCYLVIVRQCNKWLADPDAQHSAPAFIRTVRVLVVILGILWGGSFIQMMLFADPAQRGLVYGVIVACLSTPVLVAPISVAFASWLPVTILSFIALIAVPNNIDLFALSSFLGYAAMTCFCIFYLNRRLIERALSAIRVEEHGEVIKLLLRDFEENASDWLWETDADLWLRRISPRLAEVARKPPDALIGRFPDVLLGKPLNTEQSGSGSLVRLNRLIAERAAFRDLVISVNIGGEERSWSLTGKPILDSRGAFAGYHGVGSDITAARRSQEQIVFLARHDSLTKLPNRVLFNEVLHDACGRCMNSGIALLCLDLDDFKLVNDSLGHATGDGVLIAVAERIRSCIRDGDTAARLGGDEFAIIVATNDFDEISAVARRLVERIGRPYHFDGRLIEVGISVGIAMAPKDSDTPHKLLKNADLALYRAKAAGRSTWRFYDPEMDELLQDRRALLSDLRQALARGEFSLDYQPIFDLSANRIVAVEALLRWQHPVRGRLSPADFIPLAEETGVIGQIGNWVLNQACAAARSWPDEIRIAVNLSPLQFRDLGLVDAVVQALEQTGLDSARLELEITETTVLENNTQTVDALWQLHGLGVRIALDDFGTGYSSLSYLRRFPFDKIKIDRSFISDLGRQKDDSSIILAIIGLADSMSMCVTAEGVETREQAALLTSYGCGQAQGFLFCRPVHADEIHNVIMRSYPVTDRLSSAAQ